MRSIFLLEDHHPTNVSTEALRDKFDAISCEIDIPTDFGVRDALGERCEPVRFKHQIAKNGGTKAPRKTFELVMVQMQIHTNPGMKYPRETCLAIAIETLE